MKRATQTGQLAASHPTGLTSDVIIRRLEECWDEPGIPDDSAGPDAALLQGVWESVAGKDALQLLVAGNRFTVRFKERGHLYMGSFEVDSGSQPKTMAMQIEEGPAHHKGKTACCVYELDGPTLRWWLPEPGRSEKPAALPSADDRSYLWALLRRDGPV